MGLTRAHPERLALLPRTLLIRAFIEALSGPPSEYRDNAGEEVREMLVN